MPRPPPPESALDPDGGGRAVPVAEVAEVTPMERFRTLARHLVAVPRSELADPQHKPDGDSPPDAEA